MKRYEKNVNNNDETEFMNEPDITLLISYLNGTSSEKEVAQVESWLTEDAANRAILKDIARILHADKTRQGISLRRTDVAYQKIQLKIRKRGRKRILNKVYIAAACIIGVIGCSTLLSLWMTANRQEAAQQYFTVKANSGTRTSFNLPDGSLVYLNSGSSLTYPLPYEPDERRVHLEGEAYFEVAHDPDHPFIVSVAEDKMRVKVLGTKFNLTAYPEDNEIYTTLVEGSVLLQLTDKKRTERRLSDTEKTATYNLKTRKLQVISERELIPSEKATFDLLTNKLSLRKVNPSLEYAWKDGLLVFQDTPLPEVFQKMSYFYNVKIEVLDPKINTYKFRGTFNNRQLLQVLDYLHLSSKIKYQIHYATEDDTDGAKHTLVILDL